jgi:hypothetical protein
MDRRRFRPVSLMAVKKRKRPTAQEVRNKERLKNVAANRADFMKRWFAIAISVGFATAVSNMGWLKPDAQLDFSLTIDWQQVEQAARLGILLDTSSLQHPNRLMWAFVLQNAQELTEGGHVRRQGQVHVHFRPTVGLGEISYSQSENTLVKQVMDQLVGSSC